jgi:dTDP-glucose pyrophosphorylase
LAVVAVYMFKPIIYQTIEKIRPDGDGEIQLAAAIKWLIDRGRRVYAVRLQKNEKRIDIGTPETYVRDFKILSDLALDQISGKK